MAYLKKEQYEYRREAAARRASANEKVAVEHGMTEEQAALISRLCTLRHDLHTNIDKTVICNSECGHGILPDLVKLGNEIIESGLQKVSCIPEDYFEIDDIDTLQECEEWPESGTREWQDKYDDEYYRIYGELEQLNKDIEKYLSDIDKQYGTHWCPTGALRVM